MLILPLLHRVSLAIYDVYLNKLQVLFSIFRDIKPFKGSEDSEFTNTGGKFHSKTKSILAAAAEADKAIVLSRADRLALYKSPGMSVLETGDSVNDVTDDVAIRVKDDPDDEDVEMTEMGDAGKDRDTSPESDVLEEMKPEPAEETEDATGEATVAVGIKEEDVNEEEGQEDEDDYSESEMETITKEKEAAIAAAAGKAVVICLFTPITTIIVCFVICL